MESLKPYVCVDFPHFVGVRHVNSERWSTIILKPTAQEIDVSSLGCDVRLHGNGIEFVPRPPDAEVAPFPRMPRKEET